MNAPQQESEKLTFADLVRDAEQTPEYWKERYELQKAHSAALQAQLSELKHDIEARSAEAGWIPVSERVPANTEWEEVLAWDGADILLADWRNDANAFDSSEYGWLKGITHWMPLPKPPSPDSALAGAGGERE